MRYYIGADLGTSSLKLLLLDENGRIHANASRSYSVSYPCDGWSEQNPCDWWQAFLSGAEQLLATVDRASVHLTAKGNSLHIFSVGFGKKFV